ncbi:MAG: peptidase M14, partial [Bacteroidetes bacterium QH_1_64_81]
MSYALTSLVDETPTFRAHGRVRRSIEKACANHRDIASFRELGPSEEGEMLYGAVLGTGPTTVSLIAGNHAD